jgi:hypothetical protein
MQASSAPSDFNFKDHAALFTDDEKTAFNVVRQVKAVPVQAAAVWEQMASLAAYMVGAG